MAKRIEARPTTEFRKLAKSELAKLGLSPKSERYIPEGAKFKASATISKRQFVQKRAGGVSLEQLARERAAGVRGYKSESSKAQAAKQRTTRAALRNVRTLTKVSVPGDIWAGRSDARKTKHPREYRVTQTMKDRFIDLRRQKLAGRELEDGDWHYMIDMARAAGDPMLDRLSRSSQSPENDY
jgi:hypothetical protein